MGNSYTRQETNTDGDVITAAHTNNEFDQIKDAFAAGTGHTHDGTEGEGGPIAALAVNAITLGAGTTGQDVVVTFDGETTDGVLKWMEDEDYFEFSDDILMATTEKLQFRDTAIYINSSTDGQLDLVADTEIQIAATTIDINGNVDISGTLTIGSAGISEAELEVLDGLTVSTAEVNILDGDTTATSTTVADADRVVLNDNGTMVQVAVTDLAAYFDDEITAMPNLTSVGTLSTLTVDNVIINGTTIGHTDDTDLITVASGLVTVAGEISVTTLDIGGTNVTSTAAELNILDGVTATASELNHSDLGASVGTVVANKSVTVDANKDVSSFRNITLTGELDAGSLDVSGDADIDGTLEADAITVAGVALSTFIRDTVGTNMISSNTESGITVTYDTSNDNIDFSVDAAQTGITSIKNTSLAIGRDDDNLIKFTTDNEIIFEVSGGDNVTFKASGEIEATSLDISGDADIDGTLEADAITVNGTALSSVIAGTTVANATLSATTTVTDSTANTNFPIVFHDESNGLLDDTGALRYNPSTGELLVPKLTVAGTTTTVDTVTMNAANAIVFEGATADDHETTLSIVDPTADRTINLPNVSGTIPVLAAASNTAITSTPAELNILDGVTSTATELNIVDGDTSVGTTAVAGGDGIVTNDNGTMRQTSLDTFDTYLSATTKTLTNKTLTTPTITTPVVNTGLQLKNGATSSGFIEFFEDSDNGTNKVTLIGPSSTADVTLTLPSVAGTVATTASAADEATALAIALG